MTSLSKRFEMLCSIAIAFRGTEAYLAALRAATLRQVAWLVGLVQVVEHREWLLWLRLLHHGVTSHLAACVVPCLCFESHLF
jgi:hypothetical protein